MQQYSVNQYFVSHILNDIELNEIAIPEMQRPFVWNSTKVRDLMDSLYQGYPIGYIIEWKNPDVRLKDGTLSSGKRILIDGQQRITALRAAILGYKIVDKDYKEKNITIAFNPLEEKFNTLTPAIEKDSRWIRDISEIMSRDGNLFRVVEDYCEKNEDIRKEDIQERFTRLLDIKNKQIGCIRLDADLDIKTVTEIFVRINSKGVVLSQSDFAMSKIASYDEEDHFGVNLRKCIDYFCHLAIEPHFYKHISENDKEFANTNYLSKIEWLKNETDDLYDPSYNDVLRVSFTKEFERGRMDELVGLLSGRNFETKQFEEEIIHKSFQRLQTGVLDFVNETKFKRFVMIIRSIGFVSKNIIKSQNAINFAYVLYLKLKDLGMNDSLIETFVQKWFVMSILTGRYSGSPESMIDFDIKNIVKNGVEKSLMQIEEAELSDVFWSAGLMQKLNSSSVNNPILNVFFASQVRSGDKGFLSRDIKVQDLITHRGDIHHIFPKEYLKKNSKDRSEYNQIANYVYAQSEINIKIGKKSPQEYLQIIVDQCETGTFDYSGITSKETLLENLQQHCIPTDIFNMTVDDYEEFLEKRKVLMAKKIEKYYKSIGNDVENDSSIDVKSLITGGENDEIEFKSSLKYSYNNTDVLTKEIEFAVAKTIAAFMNTDGGILLVGVRDDGTILGLDNDYKLVKNFNRDGFLLHLNQVFINYIGKEYSPLVVFKIIEIDGKDVCYVKVNKSDRKIFIIKDGKQDFFIRSSASTQPLLPSQIEEYMRKR